MKVLVVNYYRYPNGDAGSVRHHAYSKLFSMLGCKVLQFCMGPETAFKAKQYDGVEYVSLRYKSGSTLTRIKNYLRYSNNIKRLIKESAFSPDIILTTAIPIPGFVFLKNYARRNGVKLIYDAVEWYSPSQFKRHFLSLNYIQNKLYNTRLVDCSIHVVAISRFLESWFANRGIHVMRMPVVMDVVASKWNKRTDSDKITLVYAGTPGRKDYLSELVEALLLLSPEEQAQLQLRVFGVDKQQMVTSCGISADAIQDLGAALQVFGRVSRERVLEELEHASFSVLLRNPDLRYAKAGFPTKAVESLSSGTPCMCNLSSDLGEYLTDGINALICDSYHPIDITKTLRRALRLEKANLKEMQVMARRTADEYFDYRSYLDELERFVL